MGGRYRAQHPLRARRSDGGAEAAQASLLFSFTGLHLFLLLLYFFLSSEMFLLLLHSYNPSYPDFLVFQSLRLSLLADFIVFTLFNRLQTYKLHLKVI